MEKVVGLIPCYNVELNVSSIIEKTLEHCEKLILIDDGSEDSTLEILNHFCQKYPTRIIIHSFEKNRGKGHALITGMQIALNFVPMPLITLDSDLQHNPDEIPKFAELLKKKYDLVIGVRDFQKMPFISKFANHLISKLVRRIYPKCPHDTQSGFRGFSLKFLKQIDAQIQGGRFETEFRILLYALDHELKVGKVDIHTIYPKTRITHFRKISDSLRVLKILFTYRRAK